MKLLSRFLMPALLIACAPPALRAQETWDAGFKLVAGNFSGAEAAGIGQSKNYGVAMFGAYILTRRQSLVFDGGYRYFPSATVVNKGTAQNEKTDGYYASALYRWALRSDDIYVQGGLRASQFRADRVTSYSDGTSSKVRGSFTNGVKPLIGVGARLAEKYSVELNLVGFESANVDGTPKSGVMVEVALGIHL